MWDVFCCFTRRVFQFIVRIHRAYRPAERMVSAQKVATAHAFFVGEKEGKRGCKKKGEICIYLFLQNEGIKSANQA